MRGFLITFLISIIPLAGLSQVRISGKVTLCDNFFTGLTVKGKLTYRYQKKRQPFKMLDTLRADVTVVQAGKPVLLTNTDTKGNFNFFVQENNTYTIRFFMTNEIYRDTTIEVTLKPVLINVCISDSTFHNHFLRKIQFDSVKARYDLKNGFVQIISLTGDHTPCRMMLIHALSNEDLDAIESKFGFNFEYYNLGNINQMYLDRREGEYNNVMYRYLDQKLNGNSKKLINEEILTRFLKKKDQDRVRTN
jgi:hypothetical protein